MNESRTSVAPGYCENCGTSLQGHYCHACGQAAHSPLRSFAHAAEEVFESFWHLDGRVLRTLRSLLRPGRLAIAYLEGRRAPYVPPMRMFVVLAALTFFVARLALHADSGVSTDVHYAAQTTTAGTATGATETSATRRNPPSGPAVSDGFDDDQDTGALFNLHGKPWDARQNPVDIAWLPSFANRWLNTQLDHIQSNVPRLSDHPRLLFKTFLASVPSALFVLVPLFALLLKIFYLRSGRVYLEHLVVALYGHTFLCLDLLLIILLALLAQGWTSLSEWLGWLLHSTQWILALWMPLYLLLMQRRVYQQSWPLTALKYLMLGYVYCAIVTCAAVVLMMLSMAHL